MLSIPFGVASLALAGEHDLTQNNHVYLRTGLGLGRLRDTLDVDGDYGGMVSSVALGDETAVGYRVKKTVFAVSLAQISILASDYDPYQRTKKFLSRSEDIAVLPTAINPAMASQTTYGLVVDHYLRPAGHLHVLGIVGGASLSGFSYDPSSNNEKEVAWGGGAGVGLGYDWWATDHWGAGILARYTISVLQRERADGTRWTHLTTATPLLVTISYR